MVHGTIGEDRVPNRFGALPSLAPTTRRDECKVGASGTTLWADGQSDEYGARTETPTMLLLLLLATDVNPHALSHHQISTPTIPTFRINSDKHQYSTNLAPPERSQTPPGPTSWSICT